ncbi:MAG: CoA-binding protein [Gemmatales bacterium]|nr:MAG: CoA-binding protein [Gemmatales bacterium]
MAEADVNSIEAKIAEFLNGSPHAVVGASRDRRKYGNKVFRVFQQNNRPVYAVNPNADAVEGCRAYPDLESLPEKVHGVSIVTPPDVSEEVIRQAGRLGIKNLWFQPGAESSKALSEAREFGMNVIANGPCLLVVLGYREG